MGHAGGTKKNHSQKATLIQIEKLHPSSSFKKPSLRPLTLLWPYICQHKTLAGLALLSLLAATITTLLLPIAIRQMLDHGFSPGANKPITPYFLNLFGLCFLLALASSGRYYTVMRLSEQIIAALKITVFRHISTLSPSFFDQNHSGEIIAHLTNDTAQIKAAVGSTASIALRNGLMVIGALLMMIITSPKLAALVLLSLPFILIPLLVLGRKVRARARIAQACLAKAHALANEHIISLRLIQAFNGEAFIINRFSAHIDNALKAVQKSLFARAFLSSLAIFLVLTSIIGCIWVGAYEVQTSRLSPGNLGQFILYAIFAASAFTQLSEVGAELAQAAGAGERLAELLHEMPSINAPAYPHKVPDSPLGALKFEHVTFCYPSRLDTPVLHDFSLTIQPGETIAFVGASGAGKSTLFSLILRFYDPDTGRILFDEIDIKTLNPQTLRSQIAYVPQDITIFSGTLRENIAFAQTNPTPAALEAAAETAKANTFIKTLKDGYDSHIGERGLTLSGGQRQRIALARAIFRNAPLLLLDEATSALDAESEHAVQQALDSLIQTRTTLIIAHRLSTVLKADRIIVMEKGRIIEEGKHQTLLAKNGAYARLARLQFTA